MTQKGLIIKIEDNHILVLTTEHTYIQLKMKDHVAVGQKIFYTIGDLYSSKQNTNRLFNAQRKYLAVASLFFALLLVGSLWGFNGLLNQSNDRVVATVMNIDINPSVKLELNRNDMVLSATAMNEDAATLDLTGIVGSSVEDAVEKIVELAKAGGFINEEDLIDDYVLITTVPMNKNAEGNTETLKAKIEAKVATSEALQEVNVALIKATKVEMREAEGKKVPVGLYVVHGAVEIDGKRMTVKEFFSSEERVGSFKEKGKVIDKQKEKKFNLAQKFIAKLKDSGYDVTTLNAKLNEKDSDMDALLKEIKGIWTTIEPEQTEIDNVQNNNPGQSNGNGNGNNKNKK